MEIKKLAHDIKLAVDGLVEEAMQVEGEEYDIIEKKLQNALDELLD